MLTCVGQFIQEHDLFHHGDSLIVATSGGKDSMALLHFLQKAGYNFKVAHCNFKLRGAESDADQQFIEMYCLNNKLTFLTCNFDTKVLAKEMKLSIQEVARKLRYDWLEQLRIDENAAYILTAHHLNDNMETMLFNLVKGTGLKGIRGMLPKNGKIVRPFLETSVQEIWDYIQSSNIQFREDSSNALTKYDRNKIRHEVLPVFEEINTNLQASFLGHFKRWRDMESYHQVIVKEWRKKLFILKGENYFISIAKLSKLSFNKSLLFELLQPFKFNTTDVNDILNSLDKSEAKRFESSSHQLIKDRKFLILSPLKTKQEALLYLIDKSTKHLEFGNDQLVRFHLKPIKNLARMSAKSNYAYIDTAELNFPLVLRKCEPGDYFYPFGLNKASGKASKKKIGKFLRDQKLSHYEKENTWLITSGERVVYLLGHRLDDRFKVKDKTKEVMEITLIK